MKELARSWLAFADKDRQACEYIKESPGLRAIAAFHVQQMIEKSLKAILVCQGSDPPRIHDLMRLAALVTAAFGRSVINADELERINQYYTFSRYPQALEMDAAEEPSAQELISMVSTGRRILDQARQLVERTPAPDPEPDINIDDRADNAGRETDHTI